MTSQEPLTSASSPLFKKRRKKKKERKEPQRCHGNQREGEEKNQTVGGCQGDVAAPEDRSRGSGPWWTLPAADVEAQRLSEEATSAGAVELGAVVCGAGHVPTAPH